MKPKRLVESIRLLLDRFRNELSGPRQATRTQLIQFLARQLEINQEAAGTLFDDLRQAGVIVRDSEPLANSQIPEPGRQGWSIEAEDTNGAVGRLESEVQYISPDEQESPALGLLRRAIASRATDIHLDPFGDEVEVRCRIDGQLHHYCRLSNQIGEHLINQLKVLASLDTAKPFHPQEGRLELPVSLSQYDVRLTATPVINGESVALRLLCGEQILRPLETLGLAVESLEKVRELLCLGEGLMLVGGPSGAGKTTTLYSLIHHLDNGHRNIVTIEDPVEYLVPGFLQLQVDLKHEVSLAAGLKTALRMDPDVVLLGEVRDPGTAAAAMRAASCGKYIFSTFHTRDAAAVVTGLRDLQIDDRSLANLRAVISQRLVRRACQSCRDTRPLQDDDAAIFSAEGITPPDRLPRAVGCNQCQHTGYHERIGVFEIAVLTPEIAAAIEGGHSERELREQLRTSGVASLLSDGLQKVRDGITTLEEVQSMSRLSLQQFAARS